MWLLVAGVPAAGLLWFVLANLQFGMRLSNSQMDSYYGRHKWNVSLADIEHVKITEWSDNYDVDVILKSGDSLRMHSHCYPGVGKLRATLRQYDINVVDA